MATQAGPYLSPEQYLEYSPSTFNFQRYRNLPSLQHYVLVAQNEMKIEHRRRQPDNSWAAIVSSEPQARVELLAGRLLPPADLQHLQKHSVRGQVAGICEGWYFHVPDQEAVGADREGS